MNQNNLAQNSFNSNNQSQPNGNPQDEGSTIEVSNNAAPSTPPATAPTPSPEPTVAEDSTPPMVEPQPSATPNPVPQEQADGAPQDAPANIPPAPPSPPEPPKPPVEETPKQQAEQTPEANATPSAPASLQMPKTFSEDPVAEFAAQANQDEQEKPTEAAPATFQTPTAQPTPENNENPPMVEPTTSDNNSQNNAQPEATISTTPNQDPAPQATEPAATITVSDYQQPKDNHSGSGKTVAVVAAVTVVFLALGFFGGFASYKYSPQIASIFSTSADVDTSTTVTTDQKKDSEWPIYSNSKYLYSVKYPTDWYGKNTEDTEAKTVSFSSVKEAASGNSNLTGTKVEIVVQEGNGKTLKEWVEANNVTTGQEAALQKLTVGTTEAYQQEFSEPKSLNTYIELSNDKVLTISYYAPAKDFVSGQTNYDKIVESIKKL